MAQITIRDLTFAYENSPENVFENVSLQIDTSWKLGLIGRNGRGKTTLLHLLMGKFEYSGRIFASCDFEYFPFDVTNVDDSALEIAQGIYPLLEQWQLERELSLLEFDTGLLYTPFSLLSFGQKTKVMLATLFLKPNAFLLIDEPTNHLDSKARLTVANYFESKSGFILVSHDRVILDQCIDHVISINKANIEVQQGNFSSWQENKQMQDDFELAKSARLKKDISRMKESARRTSDWSAKTETGKKGKQSSGLKADKGFVGHKAAKLMSRAKNIEDRQTRAIEDKSKLLKNIESAEELKVSPLRFAKGVLAQACDLSISYDGHVVFEGLNFGPKTLTV